MVRVTDELLLSPEHVTLYTTTDPLLGQLPVMVFHGASTTANYTLNSSRVQIHVYSPAGFQCFPRITISPNSPFYDVVNHLPREFQGDEVYRGLAFGLFKYFTELPDGVKTHLRNLYPATRGGRRPASAPVLFGAQHAADLAESMVKSDYTADVIRTLHTALQTQHISNVDIDFVLPPGSIVPLKPEDFEDFPDNEDEDDILDPTLRQYTGYTPLVRLLGEPIFLPTSRLRRAPSKPTSLNRTKSFTREQKSDLRMKLAELVDTEERYVAKLGELVRNIADEFRESAKKRQPTSLSPSEKELEQLFPESADRILEVNSAFMQELRKIMNDTERDANNDVELGHYGGGGGSGGGGGGSSLGSRLGGGGGGSARGKDPSGALAMARTFLEWFPKFTDCYQDYIRASQHFPQLLNSFLDHQSSFKQRVHRTGEQMIRSILIEPVQRLPRYSLLIDQIVGCLPITHPALQPMLRARDIITNICSMDDPMPAKPHLANRLRNMIESWPSHLEPRGRLILAVDFVELMPPFQSPEVGTFDHAGIFLVFPDCLVVVNKMNPQMTGRDLLREIDKPSAAGLLVSMTNAAGGPASYDLAFGGRHNLADVKFTESADGQYLWMTSMQDMTDSSPGSSKGPTSRCFLLQEIFQGKAAKLGEDIVKARVEARFPEAEREDPSWTLRSVRMPDSNLGMFAAVFQEGSDHLIEGRKEPASVRVVVDHEKGTKQSPVGHYGVDIAVNVSSGNMRRVSMTTAGLNGKQYTDDVELEDFLPTMSRRIIQLLSTQFHVSNLALTEALVSYHTKILKGLTLSSRSEKTRSFLVSSPVKLLSSLWSGGTETTPTVPKISRTPVPPLLPPAALPRSNSQQSIISSTRDRDGNRIVVDDEKPENPLVRLEHTFTGYVAALQARKGAIIGRTLLHRAGADELAVNDLYNRLIESPFDFDASSDVSAEVIFVAFEKFLRIAWKEQMGPIMTMQALNTLQERANKRVPGDFADFVNFLFGDMAPQNRRAFTAVIKLLADLLEGCGNDGDRGALTIVFAELLVTDGTASNYINLLDRLVDDCERIFEEAGFGVSVNLGSSGGQLSNNSGYESINSTTRGGKSHTGSLTSNTSSLRRKFGIDSLLRQNSKHDNNNTDRPSMWRSLSKHGRHPNGDASQSSSLSRASMSRSRSVDMGHPAATSGSHKFRRPGSRDRPPIAGAFDEGPRLEPRLETIGEPANENGSVKTPRRKRRSSLSDLRSLMEAAHLEEEDEPPIPLRPNKQTSGKFNSNTNNPSPKTPAQASRIPISPTSLGLRSPRQKENVVITDALTTLTTTTYEASAASPLALALALPPQPQPKAPKHGKTMSTSNIPTLRASRTLGVPSTPNEPPRPATSQGPPARANSSTQRLRLQSPQKLRDRLQTEKAAVDEVDASLKSELAKIAEEMARVGGMGSRTSTLDMRNLAAAVTALEEKVPVVMHELTGRQAAIQRDMESTLKASEAKVRAVDQLYREATAENEILHEKFNGELGKIVRALRGKNKEDREELVAKLKEHGEETARVKKENARLKREMVSLRAALKGGDAKD